MLRKVYMSMFLFWTMSLCGIAQSQEWKKINSEYYSLEIPKEWIPYTTSHDGYTLTKRKVDGYIHSNLAWKNQTQSIEEFQSVQIKSVEKETGENISLKEGKKLLFQADKPKTKIYVKSKDEICFKSVYETKDMFGNTMKATSFYYYKYDRKRYHQMVCTFVKEEPNIEEKFLHIIQSFQLQNF